jgi:hypothetical protein
VRSDIPAAELEAPIAFVNASLPHTWDHIRKIRKSVGEALKNSDPSLRAAAMMVTSELVENAVKYGEEVAAAPHISVALSVRKNQLIISVSNGSADPSGIKELQQRIEEIVRAPDKSTLYMARLEELLEEPTETGKLGLYRIAFEGEFDLQFVYLDQVVTITATRTYR